jgi:hypothetical protein
MDLTKMHWNTLHRTCVFASGGICGSHSAFRFVRGAKRRCTIFNARGRTGTDSTKSAPGHVMLTHMVLHPMGYAGHITHSGASLV